MKITILFFLFLFPVLLLNASQKQAVGKVFWDKNNNRVFDASDQPLQGIAVSSLDTIVLTQNNGTFSIPLQTNDIVFVIQPDGFRSHMQETGIPGFYKICYSNPPKTNFRYKGIEKPTFDNDSLYFPLEKIESRELVNAFMIGDIQAPTSKEIEFFQELIMPELFSHEVDFNVFLGDIADNYLDVYPDIIEVLQPLKTPVYMVFGNHDINYRSKGYELQSETYRKYFGPDYYSFNRGNTHFVVLNTVWYQGWDKKEKRRGGYTGDIYPQQLKWLKQNLQLVPHGRQIVLMAHIPLVPQFADSTTLRSVFSILEPFESILGIYGHAHLNLSWNYTDTTYWFGRGTFIGHIAGAACGGWWVGPYGLDSIPDATCMDGSPPGIYRYEFGQKNAKKTFIPGGKDPGYQLRFSSPPASIQLDSLPQEAIYVNVFDGDNETTVECSIDDGPWLKMDYTIDYDPIIVRNHKRRANRDNWIPGYQPSGHLWKIGYSENLTPGRHVLRARCQLNGREYSTIKIVKVVP
ncbi:MAG: calcineurin-like phosphoesterase C-terminal domain-containing protein [Prolixibacteraceae bacterium]|nr:calcineurin-like phosphoesterase C-terminal domain-containing protein [Prolixibacteraceae bacterium]